MAKKLPNRRSQSSRLNPLGVVKVPAKTQASLPKSALQLGRRSALVQKRDTWFSRTPMGKFFARFHKKKLPFNPNGKRRRFTWKTALIILGIILGVFALITAGLFAYFIRDLPNPKELSNRQINQSTKILDRNGKLIYSFYGDENRTILKTDEIAMTVKQAVIATEDANFLQHHGFDLKGLSRAIICQLPLPFCSGRVSGGGSTITQQYVRNANLVEKKQTVSRKIREIIASIEVEQIYTKDEILTGYLNQIPFGGSLYGAEAAAQTFFGKPAKELTLSQSAILAAVIQSPSRLSPYGTHAEELFARKDFVLDRMAKVGFITTEEATAAKADVPNLETPTFSSSQNISAPHFVFFVRQQLLEMMDPDPTVAEVKLDQAGYTVYTSLDLDTQHLAESVLKDLGPNTVKKYQASNAAMTAMDPKTGEILAMVGSIDYATSKSGNTNFAAALLQPGSSIKPLVYANAFNQDNKRSPASITYDLQTDFGGGYVPQNYNGQFGGPITARNSLARSLNIPAVKTLGITGISSFIETSKALGINSFTGKPSDYGLAISLGGAEVRQYELLGAYSTFANGGKHNNPKPILRIEKDGGIVKDFTKDEPTQAIDPMVAYQIESILSDNSARAPVFGTRNNLTLADRPVAAKSGTTNSNRDAWTVGFTPQIAAAVWVGNNEANKTMTKGADGSIVAAPIWKKFMTEYLAGKPVEQFTRPDGLVDFTVDMLSGKKPTDQSPPDQRVTDIFAPWQIPTEFDDVHTKVRVNKLTGKLATDLTPAELVEDRYYVKVHSEKPENPNWENPVLAWANANGYNQSPPTETDDVYTDANRPVVNFITPASGSTQSGNFTMTVDIKNNRSITNVDFSINGVVVASRQTAPWSITLDSSTLSSGTQVVTATAKNDLGLTGTAQISINIAGGSGSDKTPPGPVTGASGAKGAAPRSVKLSWTNPPDVDFSKVYVYQSASAGLLGSRVQTVIGTPGNFSTVELQNLPIGLLYFTFHTVDTSDNESLQNVTVSVTVLP